MKLDKTLELYDAFLAEKTDKIEKSPSPGYEYKHMRWMLSEIRSERIDSMTTLIWFGFIQGVLAREGHIDPSTMFETYNDE